jgi:hypothetical protein
VAVVIGIWLAILGYGVTYTGIKKIGGSDCSFAKAFTAGCGGASSSSGQNGQPPAGPGQSAIPAATGDCSPKDGDIKLPSVAGQHMILRPSQDKTNLPFFGAVQTPDQQLIGPCPDSGGGGGQRVGGRRAQRLFSIGGGIAR